MEDLTQTSWYVCEGKYTYVHALRRGKCLHLLLVVSIINGPVIMHAPGSRPIINHGITLAALYMAVSLTISLALPAYPDYQVQPNMPDNVRC